MSVKGESPGAATNPRASGANHADARASEIADYDRVTSHVIQDDGASGVTEEDHASHVTDDDELQSVADSDSHPPSWSGGTLGAPRRARVPTGTVSTTNRCVSVGMLMRDGLLEPGAGVMAVEYMGQTFRGDLLAEGQIRSHETAEVFSSPSSWAAHCKKIVNPDKRSGCGWSSIRYKEKKLEHYKNLYFRRRREMALEQEEDLHEAGGGHLEGPASKQGRFRKHELIQKIIVKYEMLGSRANDHDPCTLVECVPFSELHKMQPFLVSMTSTALAVLGVHCHVTDSEVLGYLAGKWDVNSHQLSITHAFPCRCSLADRSHCKRIEFDVFAAIQERNLTLVGWYHSHPHSPPTPTLRDCDQQLDHELRLKGASDCAYTPCVGLIYTPFPHQTTPLRAIQHNLLCYWSLPPPETRPTDYPRPLAMEYTVNRDAFIHSDALKQMSLCIKYYRDSPDAVSFSRQLPDGTTHWHRLQATLESCTPTNPSAPPLIDYLHSLIFAKSTLSNTSATLRTSAQSDSGVSVSVLNGNALSVQQSSTNQNGSHVITVSGDVTVTSLNNQTRSDVNMTSLNNKTLSDATGTSLNNKTCNEVTVMSLNKQTCSGVSVDAGDQCAVSGQNATSAIRDIKPNIVGYSGNGEEVKPDPVALDNHSAPLNLTGSDINISGDEKVFKDDIKRDGNISDTSAVFKTEDLDEKSVELPPLRSDSLQEEVTQSSEVRPQTGSRQANESHAETGGSLDMLQSSTGTSVSASQLTSNEGHLTSSDSQLTTNESKLTFSGSQLNSSESHLITAKSKSDGESGSRGGSVGVTVTSDVVMSPAAGSISDDEDDENDRRMVIDET